MLKQTTKKSEKKPVKNIPGKQAPGIVSSIVSIPLSQQSVFIQRKPLCACGGSCPTCISNKPILQAKIKAGPINDKYEQEADRIADAVIRIPEPSKATPHQLTNKKTTSPSPDRHTQPYTTTIQAEKQVAPLENIQSKIIFRKHNIEKCNNESELQKKLSRRQDSNISTGMQAHINSLSGGGAPLPEKTRSFFESRMGHDFSQVRIHTSSRATQAAQMIHAKAFTLGKDIVFNRGEYSFQTIAGKHLLAHELTHVLQQNKFKKINHKNLLLSKTSENKIQPKIYLEPEGWGGVKTHKKVLSIIAEKNHGSIFIEAPIPNATKKGFGKDKDTGFADLMKVSGTGKRAIGVRFDSDDKPLRLKAPNKKDNPDYEKKHASKSAPYVNSSGNILRISKGTKNINIADLKPAPANPSGTRGKKQISNYIEGIKHTHKLTTEWVSNKKLKSGKNKKNIPEWNLKQARHWNEIVVPEKMPPGKDFHNQTLQIKTFNWIDPEKNKNWKAVGEKIKLPKGAVIKGDLVLEKVKNAIIQYRWKPTFVHKPDEISNTLVNLDKEKIEPLINELTSIKIKKTTPYKENSTIKDDFKAKTWEKNRKKISSSYNRLKNKKGIIDRITANTLIEADKDIDNRDNISSKPGIKKDAKNLKLLKKIDLWTGKKIKLIGILREKFGKYFIITANFIRKIQSKLSASFDKKIPRKKPTSYINVAIKAIWRAVSAIIKPSFEKIKLILTESLKKGVNKKLKNIFSFNSENKLSEEIKRNFNSMKKLTLKISNAQKIIENKLSLYTDKYENILKKISDITNIAKTLGRRIKVAMVAIQCFTPPIVGCLKILAKSLISRLANEIVKYCPIQKEFQERALKIDALRNMPGNLTSIFYKILPSPVRNYFDKNTIDNTPIAEAQIKSCSRKSFTKESEAIAQLMTDLGCEENLTTDGCEKFKALADLFKNSNISSTKMTENEIKSLAPLLKKTQLTAQDIRNSAISSRKKGKIKIIDFLKSLPEKLKKGKGKSTFKKIIKKSKISSKNMSIGDASFDSSVVTPENLKGKKVLNVSSIIKIEEKLIVAGHFDIKFIRGTTTCGKPEKNGKGKTFRELRGKMIVSNLQFFDENGNNAKTSLEKLIVKPIFSLFISGKTLTLFEISFCSTP